MKLTNSKLISNADSRAIHVLGLPSTTLMTNASKFVADTALELMGSNKSAIIFCGSGNNGGDGIGAALYLLRHGVSVRCFLIGRREKMTPDTAEMERRFIEIGGALENFSLENDELKNLANEAGVIVDAIIGTGLSSAPRDRALAAIKIINASAAPVVSADIPSGVSADSGQVFNEAVKADITVTFSMAKIGHFAEPGCTFCGELRVVDIGIPAELLRDAETNTIAVNAKEISLPRRPKISHKGDYGRLLIIGGSVGYTGAPALCAAAAVRSGAGLVSLGVPQEIYGITAGRLWEPMPFPLADDGNGKIDLAALPIILEKLSASDACVIGCGLSRSEGLKQLVQSLLMANAKPLVIDADGLFALGSDPQTILSAQKPPILTPHEGEFLRLGGTLSGDRVSDARSFAKSRECILVLKGHRTMCAFPDGEVYIINAGNPGMAKGGSGDVLAGIIGAQLGFLPTKQAVITACLIHASAGDYAAECYGEYSMLPTDIIEAIPKIMKSMTDQNYEAY
ncbi:MAG: NAD(P)H-hydrate dehydratase [Oscillospiraceae bacterium]